ncbi:MAG: sugar phosphate isomerase/epimerase [Dehalococcoidia bacterium]
MNYALSTMWSQQDRFADIAEFARVAEAMGYDAIEVSHVTNAEKLDRLIDDASVRLSGLHAPTPYERVGNKPNSDLNLAALDETERRTAIDHTKRTMDYAARAGARYIVVHLGHVGTDLVQAERTLRKLWDGGTREGADVDAARRETMEWRAEHAPAHLEHAKETLVELVAYASDRGLAIGLENRLHHQEFPLPHEALDLVSDYPPDKVGYWHDVGHAEVQWRLGFVDKHAWLDTVGQRTIGAHLHDVDGIGDHRAPGRGDVEWDYIARGLPKDALRVFEINQRQPDDAVAGAIAFLRERGVVE